VHHQTVDELDRLCNLFSTYLVDKVSYLKLAIVANEATLAAALFPYSKFSGTQLDCLSAVTFGKVYKFITSIKPKTSSVDYIRTSLTKSCPAVFSHLFCILANLSFSQGVFPSMFKAASVTPLIKKAGLYDDFPANFRPISNLNNVPVSKLSERLFLYRLQPQILVSPYFDHLYNLHTDLITQLKPLFYSASITSTRLLIIANLHYSSHSI
jgi:hypothetical protein